MPDSNKIKVMIIDDSFSIRMLLRGILSSAPDIEVVASARDPLEAKEKLKDVTPDVITLDVEMPHMDGLTFLEKLMKLKPLPVVMISTLTSKGSTAAIKALELGAVDVIGKPSAVAEDLKPQSEDIISRVRAAACASVGGHKPKHDTASIQSNLQKQETADDGSEYASADIILSANPCDKPGMPPIIAIGSSTGGTEAIRQILVDLPENLPGIIITQHMAPGFISSFAKRLDTICKVKVQEAHDGMKVEQGNVYIAPTEGHLGVKRRGDHYVCQILSGKRVRRHKPSVDVMFRSVANEAGPSAMAVILTGMGDDGAFGMKEIFDTGAPTIAQDQATSIVFGMPRMAIEKGGAKEVLPLGKIAGAIIKTMG